MDASTRPKRLRTITISLVSTGLSLIPTVYVAIISNSLTLYADLLRCAVEFMAILISYIILLKTRPENLAYYNYGFGKLEHLSSLSVGGAMLVAFLITAFSAIQRIFNPQFVENAELGFYLAAVSVAGNIFIWSQNLAMARINPNPMTLAQVRLFMSKTVACLVVVISLACGILFKDSYLGLHADTIGSLAVAGFLLYSGYNMIFFSLKEMLDSSLEEGAQLLILKALVKFDSDYKNIERIRTRYGGDKNYIELSLHFDGNLSLNRINTVIEAIRKEITHAIPTAEVIVIPLS